MWPIKSVFNGDFRNWIHRHPLMFTTNLASSIGAAYWWHSGHKDTAPVLFSLCCLGASYLHSRLYARDELSLNDAVVITGCDSGLGFSYAMHCRKLGLVVIAGVLHHDGLGGQKLRDTGVYVNQLDVTNKESVHSFVQFVKSVLVQHNLALRALINNAGMMIFGEFEWQTDDQMKAQIEVNVIGTLRVTRELMPIIRAHKCRIISLSSHCTTEPLPGVSAYGATKAAIDAWSTGIRVEFKKYGIKVICLVPGSFTNESNILAKQDQHFSIMKAAMPAEAKNFYGDYFTRYCKYFSALSGEKEPIMLSNFQVYGILESALLDKHPAAIYKCEPLRYFFYHTFFKFVPTTLRDMFILKFVRTPPWFGPREFDNEPSSSNSH